MADFLTGIKIRSRLAGLCVLAGLALQAPASITANILAGGETDLPADTPSGRLDVEGTFSFVGALAISSGAGKFKGSAVALSREWVLTAGHNADLNDDGQPDAVWGHGYTSDASLTDRRYGSNGIDGLEIDDEGSGRAEVFRYDFDAPTTTGIIGGSLGNDIETIIGPGDSGGAALRETLNGWELVGINTFTEGYGGRFGDTGGGVLVEPYTDWISQTTGIPESNGFFMASFSTLLLRRRRCHQ